MNLHSTFMRTGLFYAEPMEDATTLHLEIVGITNKRIANLCEQLEGGGRIVCACIFTCKIIYTQQWNCCIPAPNTTALCTTSVESTSCVLMRGGGGRVRVDCSAFNTMCIQHNVHSTQCAFNTMWTTVSPYTPDSRGAMHGYTLK